MKTLYRASLLLAALNAGAVEPDTTSKSEAIQMAKAQNKMILLIVSDTNSCSGCITLEFSSLPCLVPPIKAFMEESFVYWACGGQIKTCRDYATYTGNGVFPLPAYFIIDPWVPQTSRAAGYGGGDPHTFYNFLTRGLLKSTAPIITNVVDGNQSLPVAGTASNLLVHSRDILIQGRSVSTNVTLRRLRYSLNSGDWAYLTITNRLTWEMPLRLDAGSNTLKFYADDISANYNSRTNTSTFVVDLTPVPRLVPVAVTATAFAYQIVDTVEGAAYVVEWSEKLQQWGTLKVHSTAPFVGVDNHPEAITHRFYRVIPQIVAPPAPLALKAPDEYQHKGQGTVYWLPVGSGIPEGWELAQDYWGAFHLETQYGGTTNTEFVAIQRWRLPVSQQVPPELSFTNAVKVNQRKKKQP